MAGRGPRKQKRDSHGRPIPVSPTGVHGLDVPAHVAADPVAADVFSRVVGHLAERGDLRQSYEFAVAMLATEWSRYVAALAVAGRTPIVEGTRGPRSHPAAGVAAQAARTVRDLLAEFGLTAASLARVDVPASTISQAALGKKPTVDASDPDVAPEQAAAIRSGTAAERQRAIDEVLLMRTLLG